MKFRGFMNENKLSIEKSLYLQQHAENPIHWNAYSDQVLKNARELNKLIFVSIGYSSCHWCHVMAHESFEDIETAAFINEHFVSIKIDREEYPDLDNYYQTACSIMTGRGGWPLTVFLTPDGKPFFVGTYFPKTSSQKDSLSFMDVLKHINNTWIKNPSELIENARNLSDEIQKPIKLEKRVEFKGHFPAPSAIMNALKNFADTKNGGYGQAPRFPHFAFYEWACEQILEGMIPQEQGQHIVESIEKMMMGGMYDHVKGGVHRYSTDEKYLVPHFEKMLYDQAGLLKVLSKLSQFYPSPLIFDGILQTLDYLKTEMTSEDNYFFSSQDADSEGTEGLYFTFSKEEFLASFDDASQEQKSKIDEYLHWFNITEKGNFEHGLNVISLNHEMKTQLYSQEGWQEVREIKRRLLDQRKFRLPPATDRKGICSWNFLMLSALTDIVQYCTVDVIRNQAIEMLKPIVEGCLQQFIKEDTDGKHVLRHTNTLEKKALYLEDYINFSEAQLRLYEITGNEIFKKNAIESTNFSIKNFVQDGEVYATGITAPTPGVTNLRSPLYDQSYRSATMTFVHLLSRLSVFNPDFSPTEVLKDNYQEHSQFILTNPLGHGEGLRALSYPLNIYRKIEVPIEWLENEDFLEMRTHFFSRFVMDYHLKKDDSYQICTTKSCEVSGSGIVNFQELFKTKETPHA
jgi:uncharacterized protein YyaL (SSP411 family)